MITQTSDAVLDAASNLLEALEEILRLHAAGKVLNEYDVDYNLHVIAEAKRAGIPMPSP